MAVRRRNKNSSTPPVESDDAIQRADMVEDTENIMDEVFGDPAAKHGLSVFTHGEREKVRLYRKEGKPFVRCLKRNRWTLAKPEEIIRQLFLIHTRDVLGYPLEQVDVEVPIHMGVDDTKKADIVIFSDETCTGKYIIIEVKKPDRKDGLEQLRSYLNATGVFFGAWSNGKVLVCEFREEDPKTRGEPYRYLGIPRLPNFGEDLDDVLKPLTRGDLQPIHDLKGEVLQLEHDILANAGVNAFDELFKLIFAKLHDEFAPRKTDDSPMQFRVTTAPPADQYNRINGLFEAACQRKGWTDIFDKNERIKLDPESLVIVASRLAPLKFHDADLDVIDAAFEYLINPEQKGAKGQYFTPRPVVKMAVKMLNPRVDEAVIDPACGSCGFLIHTINWMREHYLPTDNPDAVYRYANECLYAIDFDG